MIDSDCKSQSYAHLMVFNKMAAKPRWPPESPRKKALQWVLICPILCESFMKKAVLVFWIWQEKEKSGQEIIITRSLFTGKL